MTGHHASMTIHHPRPMGLSCDQLVKINIKSRYESVPMSRGVPDSLIAIHVLACRYAWTCLTGGQIPNILDLFSTIDWQQSSSSPGPSISGAYRIKEPRTRATLFSKVPNCETLIVDEGGRRPVSSSKTFPECQLLHILYVGILGRATETCAE